MEEKIINDYRSIAIVGASGNPDRPSYQVADYLIEQGYRVSLVNPTVTEIMGQTSYPDLASIPEPIEVVDIFRRSDQVDPIVEEAISIGAKAVWMQTGVVNEAAAEKARQAGLMVVMDKCIAGEHARITGQAD